MTTPHVPQGHHSVTPYLVVPKVPPVIAFLERVFGARQVHRVDGPGGRIVHAQVQIGDARLMMGEAMDGFPAMPACVYVYVPDTDAAYRAALEAGATSLNAPQDQFYGDRSAGVQDAAGNKWFIATHLQDVSDAECQRRASETGKA
jgi:uncharacterized glyoxalase superfamily protein PhnB